MPRSLDLALVFVFAVVWPLLEYFWLWPRHVRAVRSGDPGARTRVYTSTIVLQWVLAAAVGAITLGFARPWAVLGLRAPHGWIFVSAMALAAVYAVLVVLQARKLAASPGAQARLRSRLETLRPLIPHTSGEFRLFLLLSVTAGVCEELLFRGYMVWVLRAWIGLWGAAVVSMVAFGLGHAYQGPKHGIRAFFAGVAMGLLALATGSILPGMALHALIDLASGWITHIAVRNDGLDEPRTEAGAA